MPSLRLKELLAGSEPASLARWDRAVAASADGAPVILHLVLEGLGSNEVMRALAGGGIHTVGEAAVRLLPPDLVARLPVATVRAHHVLPVSEVAGTLQVAMADPFDAEVLGILREATRAYVEPVAIDPVLLMRSLSRYYGLPLPAALRAGSGLPMPSEPRLEPIDEEDEDVVMVEPASLDDELADLFRDEAEPVLALTRKKAPVSPPDEISSMANVPEGRFEAMAAPLGGSETPIARIEIQSSLPQPNETWEAPERRPAPAPVARDAELAQALETTVAGLREASDRDAVIDLAMSYLGRAFSRAAIFKIQGQQILGWRAASPELVVLFSGFSADLDATSTLAGVVASGKPYYGPLAAPDDVALTGRLSPPPLQAALVPVSVAGRVVLLLYGDVFDAQTVFAPRRDLLRRLCVEVGDAIEAIIRRKKLG
jgi:hypothetical protein